MGKDRRKRSRETDDGGERKKERETKGKDVESTSDPVVVAPPTEDEVDEFFAILRRMREAVKYFGKSSKGGERLSLSDSSTRGVDDGGGEVCVKKRRGDVVLDLNTVPDIEGE